MIEAAQVILGAYCAPREKSDRVRVCGPALAVIAGASFGRDRGGVDHASHYGTSVIKL